MDAARVVGGEVGGGRGGELCVRDEVGGGKVGAARAGDQVVRLTCIEGEIGHQRLDLDPSSGRGRQGRLVHLRVEVAVASEAVEVGGQHVDLARVGDQVGSAEGGADVVGLQLQVGGDVGRRAGDLHVRIRAIGRQCQ